MKTKLFPSVLRLMGLSLCAGAALALSVGVVQAKPGGGGGGGANCSITTVPDPAVIDEGQSVQFTGSVSGKGPATYAWTFEGGTTDGDTTQQTETVSYPDRTLCNPAGSCDATLNGTNGKGQACTASVTVTVNEAGGNQAPIAADDSYTTPQDTPLSVSAPGVLGNDSDPDNDPITVFDPRTNAATSEGLSLIHISEPTRLQV